MPRTYDALRMPVVTHGRTGSVNSTVSTALLTDQEAHLRAKADNDIVEATSQAGLQNYVVLANGAAVYSSRLCCFSRDCDKRRHELWAMMAIISGVRASSGYLSWSARIPPFEPVLPCSTSIETYMDSAQYHRSHFELTYDDTDAARIFLMGSRFTCTLVLRTKRYARNCVPGAASFYPSCRVLDLSLADYVYLFGLSQGDLLRLGAGCIANEIRNGVANKAAFAITVYLYCQASDRQSL